MNLGTKNRLVFETEISSNIESHVAMPWTLYQHFGRHYKVPKLEFTRWFEIWENVTVIYGLDGRVVEAIFFGSLMLNEGKGTADQIREHLVGVVDPDSAGGISRCKKMSFLLFIVRALKVSLTFQLDGWLLEVLEVLRIALSVQDRPSNWNAYNLIGELRMHQFHSFLKYFDHKMTRMMKLKEL